MNYLAGHDADRPGMESPTTCVRQCVQTIATQNWKSTHSSDFSSEFFEIQSSTHSFVMYALSIAYRTARSI